MTGSAAPGGRAAWSTGPAHPGIGGRAVLAVAVRPHLWPTALGVVRRFAEPGWWRHRPWLPLPARDLWRFRMVTAYGDPAARPGGADLVDYLEWCREAVPTGGRRAR